MNIHYNKLQNMTEKTKTVRTIYLYVVSLLSLLFLCIGIGNLINVTLKSYFFPEAEKRDYYMCNQSSYYPTDIEKLKEEAQNQEQQQKIDIIISEYEAWKAENTGDNCYASERQKRMVDSLTMILISLPLYVFHWSLIKKEKQEKKA